MRLLFPKLTKTELRSIVPITALSGLLGAGYGTFHDLITWSISNEYYTVVKFIQFSWADLNLRPQYFAAEIGFIAGGAVGLGAGWIMGRVLATKVPYRMALRVAIGACAISFLLALLFAVIGNYVGIAYSSNLGNSVWSEMATELQIRDLPSFVRVAFIHYGSYLGALLGILGSLIRLKVRG